MPRDVGDAGQGSELICARPHGHLAAVCVMAKKLRLPELLEPAAGRSRDIAYALILARVVHPRPQRATTKWWADTTLTSDFVTVRSLNS